MERPEIVLIAALAEQNRVIGRGLSLPWHLPEDLRRFKRLTTGHPLVMGRRTFDALVHQFGGPLPKRRNIVLTRHGPVPGFPTLETYGSVEAVLEALRDVPTLFIGGGSAVYEAFLPLADRLELTLVAGAHPGDVFFPPFEHLIGTTFTCTHEEPRDGFRFVTYRRNLPA